VNATCGLGMATTTVEMTRRVGGTKRKYSILRKVEGGVGLEEEEVEFLLRYGRFYRALLCAH